MQARMPALQSIVAAAAPLQARMPALQSNFSATDTVNSTVA